MPHRASHGFSTVLGFIATSMALPCNPVHPHSHTPPFQECIALYALVVPKMLFREHLCVCFWHRLGLESCWGSLVSHACPTQPFQEELASAWGLNPGGMRCFTTMPHSAPQGFSMVLAGPSRHLWLCLLCFVCLVLPCLPCI